MLLKGVRKTKKSIDKVNALRTQAIACKNRPFGHLSTFIFVRFTKLIYVNLDHKAKRQLKIRLQHVVSLLRVEIKLRFHPKFFVFNRTYFNYGLISLLQLLYTAIRVIVNSMLNTESSIWVKFFSDRMFSNWLFGRRWTVRNEILDNFHFNYTWNRQTNKFTCKM